MKLKTKTMKALILIIFVSALIMSFLIWLLIQNLKSQPPNRFDQLKIHDTFNISDVMENADFVKVSDRKAMCLDSRGASYEKSMECAILSDQKITKTC